MHCHNLVQIDLFAILKFDWSRNRSLQRLEFALVLDEGDQQFADFSETLRTLICFYRKDRQTKPSLFRYFTQQDT